MNPGKMGGEGVTVFMGSVRLFCGRMDRTEQRRLCKKVSAHADIVRLLKSGQSVRNAAKITGKGASTVQRVKLALTA
jgi:hypothetical protein